MTNKAKRRSARPGLGLRPGEKAVHKLGLLDRVIAAVQIAHDECVSGIKAGSNEAHRCSVQLFGHEASYLLRCLKAVRNQATDPFGIDSAFRENCGLSVPEQAALAREVREEIEVGRATSDADAIQHVSERRHIGFEKLKTIYYELKDFI